MSDLISRSEVIDLLYKTFDEYRIATDKTSTLGGFGSEVFKRIREMPTAYDVDKVVEELEERKEEREKQYKRASMEDGSYMLSKCFSEGARAYGNAIEIVKQGGVSYDVCEWMVCDEEANVYDTSCRNPHILIEGTPRENNYKYCPYCGKKIKVVE